MRIKTLGRSNAIDKKERKRVESKDKYGSSRLPVFHSWWGRKFKVALNLF